MEKTELAASTDPWIPRTWRTELVWTLEDGSNSIYKCRCTMQRRQAFQAGYGKLANHEQKHGADEWPSFVKEFFEAKAVPKNQKTQTKCLNLFSSQPTEQISEEHTQMVRVCSSGFGWVGWHHNKFRQSFLCLLIVFHSFSLKKFLDQRK